MMKNNRKKYAKTYITYILAFCLTVNTLFWSSESAFVQASPKSVSTYDAFETVSDNDIVDTVSENDIIESVSENDITESVSENDITETVSENDITETVSENDITESVSENDITETVSENDITETVSENDITETVSENDITESVSTNDITETVSENDIEETISENNVETSEPERDKVVVPMDKANEIWVDGFLQESDDIVYTGKKITQDFDVYYGEKLLKEGTDYTLTYSNNINAATYDAAKSPSVKITMKGQYSGSRTLYFTIQPRPLEEIDTQGYEQAIVYANKLSIPAPVLYFNGKKLAKKDYTIDYTSLPEEYLKGASYELGEVYEYEVVGAGNYTGSLTMQISIISDKNHDFSKLSVKTDKSKYLYSDVALTKEDVSLTSVKLGGKELDAALYEYEVTANGPGNGVVKISPTEEGRQAGYRSFKEIKIKVVGDRALKNATVSGDWKNNITFSQKELDEKGGFYQADSNILFYGEEALVEQKDYSVKYKSNLKAGTATVTFTGMGRYTGSLKKTYKILTDTGLQIEGEKKVKYAKGGWIPLFAVHSSDGTCLTYKTDYTAQTKIDKKTGNVTCKITGKGNYKGYATTIPIEETLNGDLSLAKAVAKDKIYSTKANAWKTTLTITDVDGKKLTAGKDYQKELYYEYKVDGEYVPVEDGVVPEADTEIRVTATGINNYANSSVSTTYRIFQYKISSLTFVIDPQVYTGTAIELTDEDIHVYANKADKKAGIEMEDDCYEILEYSKNIKVGTASVTLRGKGAYGDTKKCTFKIVKKPFNYISISQLSILSEGNEVTELELGYGDSMQLDAGIYPANAENKIVTWSSSNKSVATVDRNGVIKGLSEGKTTITLTAKETGVKATCEVTVLIIPVVSFELEKTSLEVETDLEEPCTQQMQVTSVYPENASLSTIKWKSSNELVATVDENGLVTIKNGGRAVITATAYGGEEACVQTCSILSVVNESLPDSLEEGTYVNVLDYLTPTEEDDTAGFNKAVKAVDADPDLTTIYVPAGVYLIVPDNNGIELKSNMNLVMSEHAVLKAVKTYVDSYRVIFAANRTGITITGGSIVGERYEHMGTAGEAGHGIALYDCTDVTIQNVDISACWGDGIYLGTYYSGNNVTDTTDMSKVGNYEIEITGCSVDSNRRNGLSIICASDVLIENSSFTNTSGTDPQAGVLIEPNSPIPRKCENIVLRNCVMRGNKNWSMGITFYWVPRPLKQEELVADNILLENCELSGKFYNYSASNVTLRNCTYTDIMTMYSQPITIE